MAVLVAGVTFFVVLFAMVGVATVIKFVANRSHSKTMQSIARSRFLTELSEGN